MDPNNEGPPAVVKAIATFPDDTAVNTTLYLTDDPMLKPECNFDFDGGAGGMEAMVGTSWGFRIMFSELIEGDEVEHVDDMGIGDYVFPGFVQITNTDGSTVTSALDPTMQLTPDMLLSYYQPAGGTGCFGTIESFELYYLTPLQGPAIVTTLDGVPTLPSNTEFTLWVKKENAGHKIVDTGGTPMAADFKVNFYTDPMFVDCPDPEACNVMPSILPDDQPVDPADPDLGFDMVTVQFTTWVGDPSGVYLYDEADPTQPVPDVVPEVDYYVPDSLWGGMDNAVSLTMGIDPDTETYIGIPFEADHTYWIVVTSDVLDLWGVPAEMFPDDTSCDDLATAGIDVTNCIWAGTFTVAPAV